MKFSRFLAAAITVCSTGLAYAATNGVVIGDYFFNPTNVVISPGDRIIWTNRAAQLHDSSSRSNLWLSGNLGSNSTFGFTFANPGYYPYACNRHIGFGHPEQTGSVSVVRATLAAVSNVTNGVRFEVRGGRQGLRAAIDAGTEITSLTPIATNPFPASGTLNFTNSNPLPNQRFYRARVLP